MREILFRGKRTDGQWIYGGLLKVTYDGNTYNLIFADNFLFVFGEAKAMEHACVDPSTVGQYTGLNDKNGKRIFEGDIIEWFAQGESEHPDFGYIEYDEQSFAWRVCWQKYDPDWLEGMQSQYITVIGNIFDNKDLLS